jgi:hypothetical protein
MHIMDYMSGKATTLLGVLGVAAVGVYIKMRWSSTAPSGISKNKSFGKIDRVRRIDIDDDTAAEIIKRARPQLERAVEVYAH